MTTSPPSRSRRSINYAILTPVLQLDNWTIFIKGRDPGANHIPGTPSRIQYLISYMRYDSGVGGAAYRSIHILYTVSRDRDGHYASYVLYVMVYNGMCTLYLGGNQ